MLPAAPSIVLAPDLLERLCGALAAREPARAIGQVLARCGLPDATCERVAEQALRVGERARQREPRASRAELQLALGVLLVSCGVHTHPERRGEASS